MSEIAIPKPDDVMSLYARERFGLHTHWQWVGAEAGYEGSDSLPPGMCRLRGGAYYAMSRGPRKGKPNYKKPVPGSERTVFYRDEEFLAWQDEREKTLGICKKCVGTGQQWVSSGPDGTKYRTCTRCKGTGNPAKAVQEEAA